nr:MAG TPA: hypothetical protein [Caudoviricetes sp.]
MCLKPAIVTPYFIVLTDVVISNCLHYSEPACYSQDFFIKIFIVFHRFLNKKTAKTRS